MGELLSTLLHATVYVSKQFSNVVVQIGNKMGLRKSGHGIFLNNTKFFLALKLVRNEIVSQTSVGLLK
jgi:hypothetical protein